MNKCCKSLLIAIFILIQTLFLQLNFSEASKLKSQKIILNISNGSIVDRELGSIRNLAASSSNLPVKITSKSPSICSVAGKPAIIVPRINGKCQLKISQAGNSMYAPAPDLNTYLVFYSFDAINLELPTNMKLTNVPITLPTTSKLGKSINFRSITFATCKIISNQLQLLKPGTCQLNVATSSTFEPFVRKAERLSFTINVLGPNEVNFVLPQSMSLSTNSLKLIGVASSGLEVAYSTLTPEVCQVIGENLVALKIGECKVRADQPGNQMYVEATPVIQVIYIESVRYTTHPQISSPGYRIQPVYVVPSDGQDNKLDLNGYINSLINEGNDWMRNEIGRSFSMSTNPDGSTSVLYLRSRLTSSLLSTMPSSRVAYSTQDVVGNLLREIGTSRNTNSTNSTFFIFFIDVTNLSNGSCGYAEIPSNGAVVIVGNNSSNGCDTRNYGGFTNYKVETWIHETLHGLGIAHVTSDSCDLMALSGCRSKIRLDQFRKFYVGSTSLSRIDILALPIWKF